MNVQCLREVHTWLEFHWNDELYRQCSKPDCQKSEKFINDKWTKAEKGVLTNATTEN